MWKTSRCSFLCRRCFWREILFVPNEAYLLLAIVVKEAREDYFKKQFQISSDPFARGHKQARWYVEELRGPVGAPATKLSYAYALYFSPYIQADIQYWDDTLTEEIDSIQAMVDDIPNIKSAMEKTAAIDRCMGKIRGANGTKRSFKMEIRLVQDVNQRRKYESRLNALSQMLKTLSADCKALESESARGELFVEAADEGGAGGGRPMADWTESRPGTTCCAKPPACKTRRRIHSPTPRP